MLPFISFSKRKYISNAGAKPKENASQKESNSFPNSVKALNFLAT